MQSSTNKLQPVFEHTVRDKIAQLICARIGSNMPPVRTVEQDEERVAKLLEQCPVGGLVLFNGGANTKQVLERLQRISTTPLLVAADVERGVGQHVQGYTLFPHAMALGKQKSQAHCCCSRICPVRCSGVSRGRHQYHVRASGGCEHER